MSLKIESSFKTIQDTVRSSGLHFCLQETPFSCYITVRKSLIHPQAHIPVPSSLGGNSEAELLKSRNIFLEKSNLEIKQSYHDAVDELEEKIHTITNLEMKVTALTAKFDEVPRESDKIIESKVKDFVEENRKLQIKHELACAEIKNLKSERDDLKENLNSSSVALKSLGKENKEIKNKLEKQLHHLEVKNNDLEDQQNC